VANSIAINIKGLVDPFQEYILPLAYTHDGVLHALLGLSACHMHFSGRDETQKCSNTALRHRLAAIRSLGALIPKEATSELSSTDEASVLAIVLLLVFHDVSIFPNHDLLSSWGVLIDLGLHPRYVKQASPVTERI
jgi:hypothetical protein